jgi:hypothetical protein
MYKDVFYCNDSVLDFFFNEHKKGEHFDLKQTTSFTPCAQQILIEYHGKNERQALCCAMPKG